MQKVNADQINCQRKSERPFSEQKASLESLIKQMPFSFEGTQVITPLGNIDFLRGTVKVPCKTVVSRSVKV